jgi:hypothetical protein
MLHAILTVLALSSAPTEPLKPACHESRKTTLTGSKAGGEGCHESRKTTIEHTEDGRVVIRTRTVLVCEQKGSK